MIGFGAGEPDFPTPDYIVEAAVEAARDPRNHRYTPAGGLPELKQAICAKTARDSGYDVEPAQVLVTNGGKQAVYEAFATLLDPGDEVILPAPYWTTYPRRSRWPAARRWRCWPTRPRATSSPVDQLEAARTDRTKALLFCSPSNPTGAVYSRTGRAIGQWAHEHGIWVVTDEIYEHLTYAGASSARSSSRCPSSPTRAWCSTASPRPTR